MNKQRKILITITYNEMGTIIDTKAEEVAQPDLQPTCNQLVTDTISRQVAIDALNEYFARIGKLKRRGLTKGEKAISLDTVGVIKTLPCSEFPNSWTPCSKRLPDEFERNYLVTIKRMGNDFESYTENDIAYFDALGFHKADEVVAWMPLPEPYRGKEQ